MMMTHLEAEIHQLKTDILDMWDLVQSQLNSCKVAISTFDKDIAREVIAKERRVNAFELKIDRDCENIFALFNPVAVDLRFVLAVLKINSNLERIGDAAEDVAKFVIDIDEDFDKELLNLSKIIEMFDYANNLVADVSEAFSNEDTRLARSIFKKDDKLDKINDKANDVVTEYIKTHTHHIRQSLNVLTIIRKLERVGDMSKGIAEEIIFYIEAKVLKHKKKREKEK